jgi:hypothetical protein
MGIVLYLVFTFHFLYIIVLSVVVLFCGLTEIVFCETSIYT